VNRIADNNDHYINNCLDQSDKSNKDNFLESGSTHISSGTTHIQKNAQQLQHLGAFHKVRWEDLEKLTKSKFSDLYKGITYLDLCTGKNKLVQTPDQARNTLQYYRKKGKLFVHNRRKSQQYFLSHDEAEYSFLRSTYFEGGGVQARKWGYGRAATPPRPQITRSSAVADSFVKFLAIAKTTRLYIHNLTFHVSLNNPRPTVDNPYDRLTQYCNLKENKTKEYEYRRGKTHVKFRAYPNNTVDIHISCSDNPFPLESQEDVTTLFCFIAGVHETLRVWLQDISNTITPPVHDWTFTRAEFNKDVPCSPALYFNGPNIQIRAAEGVFRIYTKAMLTDNDPYHHLFIRQEKALPKDAVTKFTEEAIYNLMKNTDTDPYTAIGNDSSSCPPAAEKKKEEDVK
jgi:hypothetical protein